MPEHDFLLNLQVAVRHFAPAGANRADPPSDSDLWLSPHSVAGFDAADFPELPAERRAALISAVDAFTRLAAEAPATRPAAATLVREAWPHFRSVVGIVGAAVREKWLTALDSFLTQIERWSVGTDWATLRDVKTISDDGILETYAAPQLLLHGRKGRVLFDPLGRFITAAEGRVDVCRLPSFESTAVVLKDGDWILKGRGWSDADRPWTREAFRETVDGLFEKAA